MTHRYEIVYIFDSTLEEAQINEGLDRHHALLKSADNAEPVSKTNHWGVRTLAYPINKSETGYYVVVDFDADPTLLLEFERSIKLDEGIIRYLLVLNEGELPAPPVIPQAEDEDGPARRKVEEAVQ